MRFQFLFCVYAIGLVTIGLSKPRRLVFVWHRLNCTANEMYTRNTSCQVGVPEPNTLNTATTPLKDLWNLKFKVRVFFQGKGKLSEKPRADWDFNACKFLNSTPSNNFMKMFRTAFLKYSNFPTHCPLKKDVEYGLRNFTVDASKFPAFVPEASFYCEITVFSSSKINVFTIGVYGSMVDANKNNKITKVN